MCQKFATPISRETFHSTLQIKSILIKKFPNETHFILLGEFLLMNKFVSEANICLFIRRLLPAALKLRYFVRFKFGKTHFFKIAKSLVAVL